MHSLTRKVRQREKDKEKWEKKTEVDSKTLLLTVKTDIKQCCICLPTGLYG